VNIIFKEGIDFESIIFDYIDRFKFLLFPEEYSNLFLDYSKNEILAILIIYKKKKVNMTEIAEYIKAPLNTATGVITRLEKKQIVERTRDNGDRRVVKINLTKKGEEDFKAAKDLVDFYIKKLYKELSEEEKRAAFSIVSKVMTILKEGKDNTKEDKVVKKVRRITIE
jgi:DNA-binding MarR family transcriptional regulator